MKLRNPTFGRNLSLKIILGHKKHTKNLFLNLFHSKSINKYQRYCKANKSFALPRIKNKLRFFFYYYYSLIFNNKTLLKTKIKTGNKILEGGYYFSHRPSNTPLIL